MYTRMSRDPLGDYMSEAKLKQPFKWGQDPRTIYAAMVAMVVIGAFLYWLLSLADSLTADSQQIAMILLLVKGFLTLVLVVAYGYMLFCFGDYHVRGWAVDENQLRLTVRYLRMHKVLCKLGNISTVQVEPSWLGKKLDTGTLIVGLYSGDVLRIPNKRHPNQLRSFLLEASSERNPQPRSGWSGSGLSAR